MKAQYKHCAFIFLSKIGIAILIFKNLKLLMLYMHQLLFDKVHVQL